MATFAYQKRRDCKCGGKYGNQGPYPRFTPQNLQFSIFSSGVHSFKEAFLFLKVKGRWERTDRYDNECKTLIPALTLYFWF